MNNGDDIHNLLRTLGHDAGIYQDLAQYNASRAAVRRAAMARPAEPAPAAAVPPSPPSPPTPAPGGELPQVLRVGQDPQTSPTSLSSILHRLASPSGPAAAPGAGQRPAVLSPAPGAATPQPARLDRLFGRLASRGARPLGR